MMLKNWKPWRLRPEMGAMEWVMEEGFHGWPFSRMELIPAKAIAEREPQTQVEAETKGEPKTTEPAAVA